MEDNCPLHTKHLSAAGPTNYNSVNGTLVKAQHSATRKWLLLLSNSWTKEYNILFGWNDGT